MSTLVDLLTFNNDAIKTLFTHPPNAIWLILIIVLAGISEALGQSVVLFINRVKARRFILAVFSSALIYSFNYFFWVFSIFVVIRLIFSVDSELFDVFFLVAFAYIPRLLGFLVFSPLIGPGIYMLLVLWSLLIMQITLEVLYGLSSIQAVTATMVGFVVTHLIRISFGYPLIYLSHTLSKRLAGTELELKPEQLYDVLNPDLEKLIADEETT